MSEPEFVREAIRTCGVSLLLDLHNLHANATNFCWRAMEFLEAIADLPIAYVHLAGGRRVKGNRILDDHLHATPDEVFELLAEVRSDAMVVIERDGRYPPFDELLAEIDRARTCHPERSEGSPDSCRGSFAVFAAQDDGGNGRAIEQTLATLYTDAEARERFLIAPDFPIDRLGLELAAESFARKRNFNR